MKIPCAICRQPFTPPRGRSTCDQCMRDTTEAFMKKYALPSNIQVDRSSSQSKVVTRDITN